MVCGRSRTGSFELPGPALCVPEVGGRSVPSAGSIINRLSGCMIFLTTCPHPGTPAPAIPMFPLSPGRWSGPQDTVPPSAQKTFVLQLEWRAGIPLGNGHSEEVNTGCPVRVSALIQGELPDHKGYQVGVGWLLPWRSPTHRDKHPGLGCPEVASGSGSGGPCGPYCLTSSSACLPCHSQVRSLQGMGFPQSRWPIF